MMVVRGGRWVWLLRAVVAVAPVLAVLLTAPVGTAPSPWFAVPLGALAASWAVFPESVAGIVVLALSVGWWAVGPPGDDALHPAAVGAAACLVAAHVAAVLASYGPAQARVPRRLQELWLRRALLVLLPVPALLAAARLLRGDVDVAGAWIAGLLGVLLATALCLLAVRPAEEPS